MSIKYSNIDYIVTSPNNLDVTKDYSPFLNLQSPEPSIRVVTRLFSTKSQGISAKCSEKVKYNLLIGNSIDECNIATLRTLIPSKIYLTGAYNVMSPVTSLFTRKMLSVQAQGLTRQKYFLLEITIQLLCYKGGAR